MPQRIVDFQLCHKHTFFDNIYVKKQTSVYMWNFSTIALPTLTNSYKCTIYMTHRTINLNFLISTDLYRNRTHSGLSSNRWWACSISVQNIGNTSIKQRSCQDYSYNFFKYKNKKRKKKKKKLTFFGYKNSYCFSSEELRKIQTLKTAHYGVVV